MICAIILTGIDYDRTQIPLTMKTRIIALVAIALGIASFSSCLPLAAGAAGGYVAHKEGYRVQTPLYKR